LFGAASKPPSLVPAVAEARPVQTIDECLDRLHRAGWSVGHAAFGPTWQVDGTNGETCCSLTL
jgi:hypothetical protein